MYVIFSVKPIYPFFGLQQYSLQSAGDRPQLLTVMGKNTCRTVAIKANLAERPQIGNSPADKLEIIY